MVYRAAEQKRENKTVRSDAKSLIYILEHHQDKNRSNSGQQGRGEGGAEEGDARERVPTSSTLTSKSVIRSDSRLSGLVCTSRAARDEAAARGSGRLVLGKE